ncbi:hypothetical protein BDY24DRAFT_410260 [Mrakia frigida]|uniref:uncharacterized protein n=1 Tax=Mrakia frigida TaxID=29902 RepID=UPI003FCC0FC2
MSLHYSQLDEIKKQYILNGFVIVDGLIPSELMSELLESADRVTEKGRKGEWKDVRVVGKQFPPFPPGEDIWGIQHLMHPDLESPVFASWYGSEPILDVSAKLLGCRREEMQLELFNLLVNPQEKDFALSWHRDDVKAEVSSEEEAEKLKIEHHGIQWNCALYDDDCLIAVPSSHSRVRTPEERAANAIPGAEMPGQAIISLKAGQTTFYNNNILHVGKYNLKVKRRTLHGCYGSPPPGDLNRAQNILQHFPPPFPTYISSPAFRSSLPKVLKPMLDRLLAMETQLKKEGRVVGFSQDL